MTQKETIWMKFPQVGNYVVADYDRTHPNLIFNKGLKVGGTTISYSLNRVAEHYQIKIAPVTKEENERFRFEVLPCSRLQEASLYFHHGYRNSWALQCMKDVRFITLLRDPLTQTLSLESMKINHGYFLNYPQKTCESLKKGRYKRLHVPIETFRNIITPEQIYAYLKPIQHCRDTELRRNLTILLIAHKMKSFDRDHPGNAISETTRWIVSKNLYAEIHHPLLVNVLKTKFFLVGVTERINEFLVLLATFYGWEFKYLYYRTCKKSDLKITSEDFQKYFPDLVHTFQRNVMMYEKAYLWARDQFDANINRLGPRFQELVKEFEAGLKLFQDSYPTSFKWEYVKYVDGFLEDC